MQRFDSFGLAFEGYGPIGDVRTKDLAGRPVDTAVTYPGGINGAGFEGLRDFIRDHRQDRIRQQPLPQAAHVTRSTGRCNSPTKPWSTPWRPSSPRKDIALIRW